MGYWLAVLGQWSEGVCEQMGMKWVKKKIVGLVTLSLNPGLSVLGADGVRWGVHAERSIGTMLLRA